MDQTQPTLEAVPEDWERGLAVIAHPDDMEYGAASAVARWTSQGKQISYLLVTRGEAGIASMDPSVAGPLRESEQRASCAIVGVDDIEFLSYRDGLVEEGVELRRDITRAIRRVRPQALLGINHRDTWGGPSWNHCDHRAVGRSLLDAARDAANPWLFQDVGAPWSGVRFAALSGSPSATHAADISDYLELGIASLRAHAVYLENLGGDMAEPGSFLRSAGLSAGPRLGVQAATTFELVNF